MDIKTAGRTLDVFEAFESVKKPTSLSELASYIGAPISSCHGLVRTLRNRGYLYSVGGRSLLYPTKRLLEVATTIAAHDPILEQLGPYLTALRDETVETVILGKRQDDQIVYLEVVEGLHTIRYAAKPGKITPLHSGSIGKAMLGVMPPAELERFVRETAFASVTENTLTTADDLIADIADGRNRGYFVTRGENVADVMAIARPVKAGASHLGIAIAGPLPRMQANVDRYAESLLAICRRIEKEAAL
ncbi:MAG: IclR family transcriptional regulator [Rhizobiaceae bacterium]